MLVELPIMQQQRYLKYHVRTKKCLLLARRLQLVQNQAIQGIKPVMLVEKLF